VNTCPHVGSRGIILLQKYRKRGGGVREAKAGEAVSQKRGEVLTCPAGDRGSQSRRGAFLQNILVNYSCVKRLHFCVCGVCVCVCVCVCEFEFNGYTLFLSPHKRQTRGHIYLHTRTPIDILSCQAANRYTQSKRKMVLMVILSYDS
jgi:hypothetical protein